MTHTHRRLLYIAFSVLFVLLAPLLLLLGAGYRFVPGQWRLAPTGYIVLRTAQIPDRIVLDGRVRAPDGKETRLPNLVAGTHEVRIEKEGYLPWQRHVLVESGVARAYLSITLVPSGPYPVVATGVTRLAAAPSGPWVALLRNEQPFLLLSRADSTEAQPVTAVARPVQDLVWNAHGDRFLALAEDGRSAVIVRVEQPSLAETTVALPPATRVLGWDPIAPENLLLQERGVLRSIRPGEQDGAVRGTNVTALTTRQETLYLLEGSSTLHVIAPGVDRSFTLENVFAPTTVFLPTPAPYVTLFDPERRTLTVLHGRDGRLVWHRRNVHVAAWWLEGRTLALGDGFEVSRWRPAAATRLQLLNRTSVPYEQLLWTPMGMLLTRQRESARLLETNAGLPVQVYDLLSEPLTEAATRESTVWLLADGVVRALIW